jgi:multiple sugar transport system ATP-binding protein
MNLEIRDKEFIVFVGPSGCGKSTTLRMIAGLEEITEGEIYIGDRLVNEIEPKDRDIAMVFQNYALYPHMTVYDNMAFGLKMRHMEKDEIDRRVKEAARILDIEDYLNRKPKQLSGGQRQRVALGRAIVREPKVFLLDEPLSNLDAKLRNLMRTEITKLHQKLNTTFIYVTHDQTEAMTMGTRIVVMKDGVIQQIDTPENLYGKPANKFVGEFIGTPQMNMYEITMEKIKNSVKLNFKGGKSLTVQKDVFKNLDAKYFDGKTSLFFGIRPEDIQTGKAFLEEHKDWQITVKVDVVEALGDETIIYGLLNGSNSEKIINNYDTKIKAGPKVRFNPQEDIICAFNVPEAHLFDKETEKAIEK